LTRRDASPALLLVNRKWCRYDRYRACVDLVAIQMHVLTRAPCKV
jgi:hypothetical protein